ncbi:hypothetical protein HDU79_009530 [Rhizoclosmatium sp. JEL0117]|nr:hypothetical protein HDU79_009530 [Rhizoclosmatium sp. JEL0117]
MKAAAFIIAAVAVLVSAAPIPGNAVVPTHPDGSIIYCSHWVQTNCVHRAKRQDDNEVNKRENEVEYSPFDVKKRSVATHENGHVRYCSHWVTTDCVKPPSRRNEETVEYAANDVKKRRGVIVGAGGVPTHADGSIIYCSHWTQTNCVQPGRREEVEYAPNDV